MAKEPYLPEKYQTLSDKEIRKEYARVRSIANKRLQRLAASGYTDTQIYKLHALGFAPTKTLTDREARYLLTEVSAFLSRKESTLTGLRAAIADDIKSLQDAGYGFVTDYQSLRQFTDFMEYSRATKAEWTLGSPTVAEKYREMEERGLSPDEMQEEFDQWQSEQEQIHQQNIAIAEAVNKARGLGK